MRKAAMMVFSIFSLSIAFLFGFAIGIRNSPAEPKSVQATADSGINTIDNFRTERQQLRQMQLSQLNEIIHTDSEPEITTLAQKRQMEMMEWSEQELTLEGILAARGFSDAVVTVHTGSVNVLIQQEAVTNQQAAMILELVTRETGISSGNVKIIPLK